MASVILPVGELTPTQYADHAETIIPIIQDVGAAALVMQDTPDYGSI